MGHSIIIYIIISPPLNLIRISWFVCHINKIINECMFYARNDQLNLELLLDKKWCLYYQCMPSVYYTLVHKQFITHPWCSAPLISGSPLSAEFSFKTKSAPATASKTQRGTMYCIYNIVYMYGNIAACRQTIQVKFIFPQSTTHI